MTFYIYVSRYLFSLGGRSYFMTDLTYLTLFSALSHGRDGSIFIVGFE